MRLAPEASRFSIRATNLIRASSMVWEVLGSLNGEADVGALAKAKQCPMLGFL